MNRSIRITSLFSLLLILVLVANLTWIQAFRDDDLAQNPLNARGFFAAKSTPRGQISTGGQVLAESSQDDQGYYQRSYITNPTTYAPVVGYFSDVYGAAGLELGYNSILNGSDSSLFTTQWLDVISGRPTHGANIELTLDPNAQQTAYEQLSQSGYEGAVVALRPSTGEVLAMASSPSFDPNQIVNPATAEDAWAEYTSAEGAPLLNHATQESLPPGSIFKIITTAAALENGYSADSTVTAEAAVTLPGTNTTLTNYGGQTCAGGGTTTLLTAFQLSCNTAFVETGIDVGADALRASAEDFGVGQTYSLGLDNVPGGLGEIPDDAALGQSSIGQRDVQMNVLQAAVMAGTVSNGGVRMEPYLVSRVTGQDLSELSTHKPKSVGGVEPEIAEQLKTLMEASERNTSGYTGIQIASKTGTAEHGDENTPPHTWYVAFNNDIAVAVLVKDGGGFGTSATGGQVAAPIGRAVLQAAGGF
ncbi:penicillin-binding transpeptidase domain-containing protein [Corynebacterium glutamicum]|uniref:penicillin-binding transpeptidase domain-containing protein n=1 Tax=Corynebacterium glutamicum TaxID=1718 RepID=UPI000943F0EE|nr:penicillin-binding protein 2 [Corynebacterium glutamicum]OKX82383.1 penicillin-binding protein [Corynebacterium glutamicum]